MKEGTYKCVIPDQSSARGWCQVSWECDHNHRTYSGAMRCLNDLATSYPDGTCDQWAWSGTVWQWTADGWRSPDMETIIEFEENRYR